MYTVLQRIQSKNDYLSFCRRSVSFSGKQSYWRKKSRAEKVKKTYWEVKPLSHNTQCLGIPQCVKDSVQTKQILQSHEFSKIIMK